jgi:hypothetical protein
MPVVDEGRGGDDGLQPAADGAGELLGERNARISRAQVEELDEESRLRPVDDRMKDAEPDDDRQLDDLLVARFDHKKRIHEEKRQDCTGQIDQPVAEPVRRSASGGTNRRAAADASVREDRSVARGDFQFARRVSDDEDDDEECPADLADPCAEREQRGLMLVDK